MPIKKKVVKKVIAKRTVKTDIPSAFDMKTGIDVGNGKKTIQKTKKVNPFVKQPMAAMMNIPVPTKKVVAKKTKKVNPFATMNIPVPAKKVVKKKKKVVKKPKFNYSKSFNFTKK